MTLLGLLDEEVVLHHRSAPTVDASGEAVYTETTETVLARIAASASVAEQEVEGGAVVAHTLRAFFPPHTDLSRVDYVTVRNRHYEVVNEPWEVFNPRTGKSNHVAAVLGRRA